MIEPIAWPPSEGAPSTSTTLRPSFAASSAAETPEIPAPSTQMSASMVLMERPGGRRVVRVGIVSGIEKLSGASEDEKRSRSVGIARDEYCARGHGLYRALRDGGIAARLGQHGLTAPGTTSREFGSWNFELETLPVDVDADAIAVIHQRDGPAHRRLRGNLGDCESLVAEPGELAIGDKSDFVLQSGRVEREHDHRSGSGHARATLGSHAAHHEHVSRTYRAR